jgi:hypothetical protein
MRALLRVAVGLVTAAVVYLVLAATIIAIGGSECDRGDCNFIGDVAAGGTGRWLFGLGVLAVAIAVGTAAARAIRG